MSRYFSMELDSIRVLFIDIMWKLPYMVMSHN